MLSYIGLGSNLQNPKQQITNAVAFLESLPGSQIKKISSYYRTSPVGVESHPEYINAVVELLTSLGPIQLLDELLSYEQEAGRGREKDKIIPRPIDLDILIYGDEIIQQDYLQVPHPRMWSRGFVLVPLYEIAPKLVLPRGEVLQLMIESWRMQSPDRVERLNDE